jgi:hypothetical protein
MVNIENATAVKTARAASLSGLKPLSFPLTAIAMININIIID